MRESGHLNPIEETGNGCPVSSKYGRTSPNKPKQEWSCEPTTTTTLSCAGSPRVQMTRINSLLIFRVNLAGKSRQMARDRIEITMCADEDGNVENPKY